ncbi:MAG: hypothetical protein J6D03_04695 [Clostridia bacterium]|nr:hypothetical protein [Clostridia bacterium]
MKAKNNTLKIILAILVIILISLISFVGIFAKDKNRMKNILPDYKLGMEFKGGRVFNIKIDDTINTEYYDKDGNKIESSNIEEGKENEYTKKEVPVNSEDLLNDDDFEKTKNIVEDRLTLLGVTEYEIRKNSVAGEIYVTILDNKYADTIISQMVTRADFKIVDTEDKHELLTKDRIKDVKVGYGNTGTGTSIFLNIQFDKEGTEKLREISKNYIASTDEQGNETKKQVDLVLDGETLLSTHFDEEVKDGILQLSMGNTSTTQTSEQLQEYLNQASNLAVLLKTDTLPLTYKLDTNLYVQSEITSDVLNVMLIITLVVSAIITVFTIIKYKKLGLFSIIGIIGYIATLLIALRYTNVVITIAGILAIILSVIMNYIYIIEIIKNKKNDTKSFKNVSIKFLGIYIPCLIISIVFSFIKYLPIASFGMVMFWALAIMIVYNLVITRVLMSNSEN